VSKQLIKSWRVLALYLALFALCLFLFTQTSCLRYGFKDKTSIPDSIKTVKVNLFENRARYVNPQLSPRLSDRVRQKVTGQTKLTQTNNDNADWEISGEIRDYSVSTSGISNQQEATNRLAVSVHVTLYDRTRDETKEFDISRNYDFSANQSLQQAETRLLDEMIRTLTDDIFNRIFSDW
jgi:Lipopolysaccharide-assembly